MTFEGLVEAMEVLAEYWFEIVELPAARANREREAARRSRCCWWTTTRRTPSSPSDLLSRIDGTRYELHWVSDAARRVAAVADASHDVCLVDYRLGAEDGIELVRELVADGYDRPIIVLTGLGDRAVDVEATRAGAADYLVKGEVTPALLERTIRYAMRRHADMRALRESEEGLRQGQRMEAVGRFAGGVAHDFNNMMSAVVGFSALVLDALEPDDPLRRYVEEIQRAGERASGMTKQLLAFTRKQVLLPQVLDLNERREPGQRAARAPDRRGRRARHRARPRPSIRSRPTAASSSR